MLAEPEINQMPFRSHSRLTRAASWWALGALSLLGGCDDGASGFTAASASKRTQPRAAYINRFVNSTYEGIELKRDGTYNRTIVDRWGRAHQQQGTWRGYGGTIATNSKTGSHLSRQIELNSYSETRDLINSPNPAPTKTKLISPYEYYIR
jgi:hypothetical protein